ncbi:MAG: Sulfoquinovosidase [Promethearchaeota archaeon]|nr:MAG: Sulfoquinovosidase [Candidatus Lokiarchaeota archaeon]
MKLEISDNGFKIFYKNYPFLYHSIQNPLVKVGMSKGKYRMRMAEFKIREHVKKEIVLINFKIISHSDSIIKILFSNKDIKLELTIQKKMNQLELNFSTKNKEINRFWINIVANNKEAIFGCGEQYSELNLRGKEVPLFVEEQGVGRGDPPCTGDWYTTYYPQPTFISSNNYFCHVVTTYYSKFNFTNSYSHQLYVWEVPKTIIIGKFETLIETVSHLSELLGRQPSLVDWAYEGIWLGVQGGKKAVEKAIETCEKYDIQLSGVWCQDWEGINMTCQGKQLFWNWEYDEELYPDLPTYIRELNKKGIKFLGYINPYLNNRSPLYKEAKDKGFLLKTGNNEILYDDSTPENCFAILDLSNPEAFDWIKSVVISNMINIGLDGYMCDYGEYTPLNINPYSGMDPEAFHNLYPVLWAKANYEALKESNTLDKVTFFNRSGYTHSSRYVPIMWAGDQLVTWSIHDGIASVIPAGLSLGLCGIGYFHFDIGGFHSLMGQQRTKEIFLRWTELAAFSIIMRSHEGIKPWDNWQYDSDEETLQHLSKMVKIHGKLKPYFKEYSKIYQEQGLPIMRPCFLHYEDPLLYDLKYQFLLGRDLLMAPVIKPQQKEWKVYLPQDNWVHIWSGKECSKGWITIPATIGQPPVFYRTNSKFKKLFENLREL